MRYWKAHSNVAQSRGKATAHECRGCGGSADEWAYQYTDPNPMTEGVAVYSTDPKHYEPMCKRCHRRFDLASDPSLSRILRGDPERLIRAREALGERRSTDGAFKESEAARLRELGRANSRAGGEALAARMRIDPDLRARASERGKSAGERLSKMKRYCECGMASNPGALAGHLKRTGHSERSGTWTE